MSAVAQCLIALMVSDGKKGQVLRERYTTFSTGGCWQRENKASRGATFIGRRQAQYDLWHRERFLRKLQHKLLQRSTESSHSLPKHGSVTSSTPLLPGDSPRKKPFRTSRGSETKQPHVQAYPDRWRDTHDCPDRSSGRPFFKRHGSRQGHEGLQSGPSR